MAAVSQEHVPPPHPRVSRRPSWRGIAIGIGSLIASLAVLYLVGINVFLRTRLFRNAISADPVAFRVEYTSAYSLVPGRIHVEGLTIRGRDSSIEWILAVDKCDFRVAFTNLIHKRFHASHVRASGFTIRVRLRIPAADATPELVAALPPVPGFADPPYAGAKPPPLTDANYNLWMVQLDDVDVEHVREIWIHTVRGQGDMRVRGRWVFRPLRWLEVGPASVDVTTLDVSMGSHPFATGLHGAIDATVHPFDLRKPQGLQVLDYVSTKTQLAGIAMTANVLRAILPSSDVTLTRAEGVLNAHLLVDHGALVSGTHVWTESADTELAAGTLIFDSAARVEFDVEGPKASVHGLGSNVRVSSGQPTQARASSIDATVFSRRLEIAHAFNDASFDVAIRDAETKNLGEWEAHFFPAAKVAVRAGLVRAECRFVGSVAEGRAQGDLEFAAERLSATRGADKLAGDVTGRLDLRDASLAEKRVDLSGSRISLRNARATWRGVHAQAPIVTLQATRALVSAERAAGAATIIANDIGARAGPASVEGKLIAHLALRRWGRVDDAFELSGSDVVLRDVSVRGSLAAQRGVDILTVPSLTIATSRLTIAPKGNSGTVSVDMPSAAIADLRALATIAPLPYEICVEKGRLDASMHVDADLGSGSANGDALVVARELKGRFGSTTVTAGLTVDVKARRDGYGASGREVTNLSGSRITIAQGGIGQRPGSWWGDFELRDAILRTRNDATFEARVHGTARDAGPATALVADNAGVPAWAANAFRMPNLQVDGEIRATGSSLELRSMRAQGGPASVRIEYAKRGAARQQGAMLLDLGWVELGYDLSEGSAGLVVLGSEGWFDRKSAMIRADISPIGVAEKQAAAEPSSSLGGCLR